MTNTKLAAGVAAAMFAVLSGSIAVAAHAASLRPDAYVCRAWNLTKMSPPVTHCITWTQEGAAHMRAANCDPAMMGDEAMRAQCAALMGGVQADASAPAAAG
jgi:hypothetical protein